MGKKRRGGAAGTGEKKLLAVAKKGISKEKHKQAKKKNIAKPKAIQLNRVLKSAVEEIVRQLSNSPQQTFTLAQVRQAYQERYERNDTTEIARITPMLLLSIQGIYCEKKSRRKSRKYFYYPKAVENGLFLKQCTKVVEGIEENPFSLKQFRHCFRKAFSYNQLAWGVDAKVVLESISWLKKTRDEQYRRVRRSRDEVVVISETEGGEEFGEDGRNEAGGEVTPEETDLKTVVVELLGQLPGDCFTRKQVENVYKKKFKKKTPISSKFLRSIHGVYGKRESNGMEKTFFFFPKTMKSGLFAKQCVHVATSIEMSSFSFPHFKCRFLSMLSCCQVPWQESDSAMGDYLASIPGLRRLPNKKFCIERASTEEEEVIEISGTEEEERRQEGERTTTGEGVVNVSMDILPTLPVPFRSLDFYVAYFNSVGNSFPKRLNLKSEREFFLSLPCVYAEESSDNYFYLPTAVDCGVFYDHCLFVWNRSPIPFDYDKFCNIFKKLFDVGRLPWQEKSIWEELMEAHPRMDLDEQGRYFLMPLTYDEESGDGREQPEEEDGTREGDEQQRNASGIEDNEERDGMEMDNEDEMARRVAVSKEETNGSTSRASSKAEDVGHVVVNMMEYAEKRGVDMDELTAAVLRTITDRL